MPRLSAAGLPIFLRGSRIVGWTVRIKELLEIAKQSRQQLGRGAGVLVLKGLWAVLNYVSLVVIARALSDTDFGKFSFIIAFVTFVGIVSNLGIQNTTLRFVNEYKAKKEKDLELGAVQTSIRLSLRSAAIAVVICLLGLAGLTLAGILEMPLTMAIGLLLIPGFNLADTFASIGRSYGAVFVALAPRDVIWRGLLIPAVIFSTSPLVDADYQLEIFLLCAAALMWLALLWQGFATRRIYRQRLKEAAPDTDTPSWRRVAWPLWLAAVAAGGLRTIDVVVLGLVIEPALLGGYFAASRTALLLSFVHNSINVIVGPQITKAFYRKDEDRLRRVLFGSAALAFLPALGLMIVFAFFGREILALFSPRFADAWPVLIILSAGQLISTFCGSIGVVFNMTGYEKQSLRFLMQIAGPGLFLMIVAAYFVGPVGAAAAVAGWQSFRNIRMLVFARREIGFDTSIFALRFQPKTENRK